MRIGWRTVVIAAAVLAAAVPLAPLAGVTPAHGAGATSVAVTGTVSLSGPVQPVCSAGTPCPPVIILTPPPTGKQSPPYTVTGSLRSASFSSSTCTGAGTMPCMVAVSGSWHGYCDLASGRWSVGVKDAAGVVHILNLTWELVGRTLAGRGHATRSGSTEVGDTFVTAAVTSDCVPGTTSLALTAQVTIVYPKLTV